jgi:hypothetical protein
MEEIVTQILKELGIKLLEANLNFINEADRKKEIVLTKNK